MNYKIHTDAIKVNLIPPKLTSGQVSCKYASEADLLNVVLFGKTAKQWRDENPNEKGNMRDVATINQLLVLANLESYNAVLIKQGKRQKDRIQLLRQLVVQQLQTLESVKINKLPEMSEEEQLELLATDGMLVKRPLVIGEDFVLTGFKEAEWKGRLK